MVSTTETRSRDANAAAPWADEKLVGLLGQFDDPHALRDACARARAAGYRQLEAYSPFPVHGIDAALGTRRSRLPFFVLAVGILGCGLAVLLQWYVNRADFSPLWPGYAFIVSGKPLWSLPANIPVTFEVVVLFSAFATFFGMLALNRLPRLAHPLLRVSRFRRASNDRFFLMIDAADPRFEAARVEGDLNAWGAAAVEPVRLDLTDHRLPPWFKRAALVLALLLLLPPALIYRAHYDTRTKPRLHFVPDMDWQYRFGAQNVGPNWKANGQIEYAFEDVRVMRPLLEGTIPRGSLQVDGEYFMGIRAAPAPVAGASSAQGAASAAGGPRTDREGAAGDSDATQDPAPPPPAAGDPAAPAEPDWVTEFPQRRPEFPHRPAVDARLVERGRERFNIYCAACHGYAGDGDGLVNQRALELAVSNLIQKGTTANATWTPAKSLHDPAVVAQPVGRIFDTITHGRGTMGPYGRQIPTADRWAIVLYVKALQATRGGAAAPVPASEPGE